MNIEKLEFGKVTPDDIFIGVDKRNDDGESWHFHPHWELKVYELDGKVQVVIIPQREIHRNTPRKNLIRGWVLNCGKPMLCLSFFSLKSGVKDYYLEWDEVDAICPGGIIALIESIVNAKKRNASTRLLNGLLETLWSIIFEILQNSQNRTHKNFSLVCMAQYYIERNYHQLDLSVESVAAHLGITAGYLINLFKKHGTTTAHEYIIKTRMNHALPLLRSGCYTVKDVASMTGWNCPFYFSNCFSKHFGVPPSKAQSIPDDIAPANSVMEK